MSGETLHIPNDAHIIPIMQVHSLSTCMLRSAERQVTVGGPNTCDHTSDRLVFEDGVALSSRTLLIIVPVNDAMIYTAQDSSRRYQSW